MPGTHDAPSKPIGVHNSAWDWVALIGLVSAWGSSFAFTKIAVETITPAWVAAFRLALGCIIMLPVAIYKSRLPPLALQNVAWYFFLGFIGAMLPFLLVSWSTQHISSALAGILMAFVPLCVMIFAHLLLKDERMEHKSIIGVLLGLVGVVIILGADLDFRSGDFSIGISTIAQLGILGATMCYALNSVATRRFSSTSPLQKTIGILGAGAIMATLFAIQDGVEGGFSGSAESYVSVLILGIFPTGIAAVVLFWLLERRGSRFVAYGNYMIPAFASFLGFTFLSEPFAISALIGLIVILIGISVSQSSKTRRKGIIPRVI